MLVMILVLGLFPNLLFKVMNPAVGRRPPAIRGSGREGPASSRQPGTQPDVDYHALAPEIVLAGIVCVLLLVDLFLPERSKWALSTIAGLGLLASFVPIVTLAVSDTDVRRMFGGAYVVDDFALVLKAPVRPDRRTSSCSCRRTTSRRATTTRASTTSCWSARVLGMVMMSSSRDLISIFVALEFLSIPAYMLAAWRKRDPKSNEAGVKYFLLGVFSSAVMLYGMSLLYGVTGHDAADRHRRSLGGARATTAISPLGIVFVIVGLRLQGVGGALPHLGARHLRGRADTHHRLLVGGVEGGRLRGPARAGLRRLPRRPRRCGSRCSGCCRR